MNKLQVRIKLEELITKREGMIIANKTRELKGEHPAYYESDFKALAAQIYNLVAYIE